MAAARRASLAMRRPEERGPVQERSAPKHCREERTERTEPEEPRHRTGHIKPTSKPPGEKRKMYCPQNSLVVSWDASNLAVRFDTSIAVAGTHSPC